MSKVKDRNGHRGNLYWEDLPSEYKDNSPHEEHDCGPEGLLHINGSIHIFRKLVLFNCRKVVADEAEMKLEQTLQFLVGSFKSC